MREEDRIGACEALQEIETDVLFEYIEAVKAGKKVDASEVLITLEGLLYVMEKVCKNSH